MAYNVDVYKGATKLGSGSCANGSASISSFTPISGRTVGSGRNVQVVATSGSCIGQVINTRIVTDGGSTLTAHHKAPHI